MILYQRYNEKDHKFAFPCTHTMDHMRKHLYQTLQSNPTRAMNEKKMEKTDKTALESTKAEENKKSSISFDPSQCTASKTEVSNANISEIKHITPGLSNNDIAKIPVKKARLLLISYARERGTIVHANFLSTKTHQQLILEMIKARDTLAKADGKKTKPIQTTPLPSKQSLAENLRGVNTANFDPRVKTTPSTNGPTRQMKDDEKEQAESSVLLQKKESYIHVEMKPKSPNINVPNSVKTFIMQLRKADPSIQVLPYDADTFESKDSLSSEVDLPNEASKLDTWIKSIETRKRRLCFSIRIATISLETVKTVIYSWCKENKHYTTFLDFRAYELCAPGWFYGICPFYYNRNHFLDYIVSQAPALKGKIIVYKKEAYHWDKENGKASANCIVIEGDTAIQNELFVFLRTHKWSGRYHSVKFVPYKTNEVFTVKHKIEMFKKQNEYAANLGRIIIKVRGADTPHKYQNTIMNFQDWLFSSTLGNKNVITGVELAPNNLVRILYQKNDRFDAEYIVQNLFAETEKAFGSDITSSLLNKNDFLSAKTTHVDEISHAKDLINITGNPQGGSETSLAARTSPKMTLQYGSFLEVTKGNDATASVITQDTDLKTFDDLKQSVLQIRESQTQLENKIMHKVDTTITTKIQPIQKDIEQIKQDSSDKFEKLLTEISTMKGEQATSITSSIHNALAAYFPKPPNGRAELPSGGKS